MSLRAALLSLFVLLPAASASAQEDPPYEESAPRREKLFANLAPQERLGFNRLFRMARGKPRARDALFNLGENLILLRALQQKKEFMTPEKYGQLQEDGFRQIDALLQNPMMAPPVMENLGESLLDIGYDPRQRLGPPPGMQRPPEPVQEPAPAARAPFRGSDAGRKGSVAKAQEALQTGDYEAAEAEARLAVEKHPKELQAHPLRAMALALLGHRDEAAAEMDTVLRLDPKNTHLLAARAFVENQGKRHREAVRSAEEALAAESDNAFAWYQKSFALGVLGERDDCLRTLNHAAKRDPARFKALFDAAQATTDEGELRNLLLQRPMPEASPLVSQRRKGPLGLFLLLAVLAAPFVLLYRRRKKIATWIVRQGLGEAAATPVPALPAPSTPQVTPLQTGQPLTPAATARIPTGYKLIRQIGTGGMGAVYEAEDVSLERRVAIKKMLDEIKKDPRELERFLKEARTVAKLRHPNIIEIHAIVESEGDVYLVFELIDGMTLEQALGKHHRLSAGQARLVLRQVCAALAYAHERGIIHRDLKPSNIMITRESLVKVMDFGVARQAKDVLNRLSMTNTVAGTPPYMAPESETGVVRVESDLYSLAVLLYEMLTGVRPFEGTGAGMLMTKMSMRFDPPSRKSEGLPPGLDAFFQSALHVEPEKRYPNAAAFLAAFESSAGFTPPKLS
ncbi:MAG TPA: hypothetical protein DCM05_04660 [Elusimicrobia bacterium]|nr:hypothetical protein [Elusimicrobiota bacterium]